MLVQRSPFRCNHIQQKYALRFLMEKQEQNSIVQQSRFRRCVHWAHWAYALFFSSSYNLNPCFYRTFRLPPVRCTGYAESVFFPSLPFTPCSTRTCTYYSMTVPARNSRTTPAGGCCAIAQTQRAAIVCFFRVKIVLMRLMWWLGDRCKSIADGSVVLCLGSA